MEMILCNQCGKFFPVGMNEDGFPNGVGFEMQDGSIYNVCSECIIQVGREKMKNEDHDKSGN